MPAGAFCSRDDCPAARKGLSQPSRPLIEGCLGSLRDLTSAILAGLPRDFANPSRPKFAHEVNHSIDHRSRIIGLRRRLNRLCRYGRRSRRNRRGSRQFSLYPALKNERRPHAHAPRDDDLARVYFRLNFGVGIVDQGRDEKLIDRSVLFRGFIEWQGRNDVSRSERSGVCVLGSLGRRNKL